MAFPLQRDWVFYQRGVSLPSPEVLSWVLISVYLSTVVVTPPTCSYYLFYYLYGVPVTAENREGSVPVTAENREGSVPVTAWKTGPNHQKLWINLVARVAVGTPRSYFQRPGGSV